MDDQQQAQNPKISTVSQSETDIPQPGTLIVAHDDISSTQHTEEVPPAVQAPPQQSEVSIEPTIIPTQHTEEVVPVTQDIPQEPEVSTEPAIPLADHIEEVPLAVQAPPQQSEVSTETDTTSQPEILDTKAENKQWQYQSGQLSQTGNFANQQVAQEIDEESQSQPQDQSSQPEQNLGAINWVASELASHEKSSGWFVKLTMLAVLAAAIMYLITRDIISTAVILLVGITLGMYAKLKPREMSYSISDEGIMVGNKHFDYADFRSFSVIDDGKAPCLELMAHKRLKLPIFMYFTQADGDRIVDLLGTFLPYEQKEVSAIDKLSSKIHF